MSGTKDRRVHLLVTALLVAAMASGGIAWAGMVPTEDTVMMLPVGQEGVTYAGLGDEMEPWGPTALAIDADGRFWIADAAAERVLCRLADGGSCGVIDLAGQVARIGDLEVVNGTVWVLDMGAQVPTLLRLGLDGAILAKQQLPEGLHLEDGLSGLDAGEQGEILVEREGGAWLDEVVSPTGEAVLAARDGYESQGRVVRAYPADMSSAELEPGLVDMDGIMVTVEAEHAVGGLQVLGFAPDGSVYVVADEVMLDGAIRVDETVRHIDVTGKVLGMARVPLSEQVLAVPHNLAVGPDGGVFALVPTAEALKVERLAFTEGLEPILPQRAAGDETIGKALPGSAKSCVSWSTMITVALSYLSISHYYTSTNTDGYCAGRGKPRYLGGAGTYSSVSYDWGGFDTVNGFLSYMDSGYQAGDINTASSESCSKGVDCSGFVSRCWKLTSKYSTRSLPGISYLLGSTSYLADGDIMNKYGSHVVLFTDFVSSGIYTYESTTGGYDRVVKLYRTWTYLSGYEPRRYNNKC